MWVQFISTLLPAQEISKLVTVPMKSHSYCGTFRSGFVCCLPQWSPFSRFQVSGSTLPLFQGSTKKEVWKTYIVRAGNKFWVTV